MKTLRKYMMHPRNIALGTLLVMSCASAPEELLTARETYANAEQSTASQYAPTELDEARDALIAAEEAFEKLGPKDEASRTLAYVATRKAQLAVVVAETYASTENKAMKERTLLAGNKEARETLVLRLNAKSDLAALTNRELEDQRTKLRAEQAKLREAEAKLEAGEISEDELAAERVRIADLTARLDAEREARLRLESELSRTRAELEKVASINEEPNRMIITLNGSVLFQTGESDVRLASTHRLDQVAQVLLAERNATITVVGYTDAQGSTSNNQSLSERRATSVRNYLVQQGVATDRISSKGLGEADPIAPNSTSTGRANNRRVEIVVDRDSGSASL